jgi:phosphoribosyl 1,2-cyclic phosphate phosphodiesterase
MNHDKFHITVLGSGTSSGVPTIGCKCEVCQSTDPRDKRLRPSILVQFREAVPADADHPIPSVLRNVVIDTTPDFRAQVLKSGIERLDAVLYTHAHADHILGLDDVRPFNYFQREVIPLYGTEETFKVIQRVFEYAFKVSESTVPKLELRVIDGSPFHLFGVEFTPIRLEHGKGTVYGYRFGDAAYLTDHSNIPDESKALLQNLDVLFLDALRRRSHPTHTTLDQAVALVDELKPRRAFFTHMCHDLHHARTNAELPPHVRLAYDGLEIDVERDVTPFPTITAAAAEPVA